MEYVKIDYVRELLENAFSGKCLIGLNREYQGYIDDVKNTIFNFVGEMDYVRTLDKKNCFAPDIKRNYR